MTISEQDLHDALRPLAGDPLEDARAVLASLPAAPPPGLPGGIGTPTPPLILPVGSEKEFRKNGASKRRR